MSEPVQTDNKPTPSKLDRARLLRFLSMAAPYKRFLIVGAILGLLSSAANFALPALARLELNQVLQSQSLAQLDRLGLLMGLAIFAGAVLGFTEYLVIAYAGQRIVLDLRLKIIAHLQRLPIAYFDKTRSGDLTSILSNDVSQVQQVLTGDIASFIGNVATLFVGIGMALYIDWKLTLVVVTMLCSVMSIFVIFGWRLRRISKQTLEALSDAMGSVTEALGNIRLTKAFAREEYQHEGARERLTKVFKLGFRSSIYEGGMHAGGFLGFVLVLLGVMWFGGRKVFTGTLSAGDLLAFFMTVTIISGPLASLATLYARLQRASGAADRLFEVLDQPKEAPDPDDAVTFPDTTPEIRFEGVGFQYVNDSPVLREIDLTISAGRVTALVGPSGCGKTTVASLLYRFYEPQSGAILVDGRRLDYYVRKQLRENIGIVPQDPMLFNGTLRENLSFGKLDATDEELLAAAEAANVTEFLPTLPDGLDSIIGERGVTLSGGQRQRVAIARAVLKNPRILILDEATSSLDTLSETLVQQALQRLMEGRTTLVIAHRLTTIRAAHQIAVLREGKVIESGSHDELVVRAGAYLELLTQQPDSPAYNLDLQGAQLPVSNLM